jgi:hypothetical protein
LGLLDSSSIRWVGSLCSSSARLAWVRKKATPRREASDDCQSEGKKCKIWCFPVLIIARSRMRSSEFGALSDSTISASGYSVPSRAVSILQLNWSRAPWY